MQNFIVLCQFHASKHRFCLAYPKFLERISELTFVHALLFSEGEVLQVKQWQKVWMQVIWGLLVPVCWTHFFNCHLNSLKLFGKSQMPLPCIRCYEIEYRMLHHWVRHTASRNRTTGLYRVRQTFQKKIAQLFTELLHFTPGIYPLLCVLFTKSTRFKDSLAAMFFSERGENVTMTVTIKKKALSYN